MVPVQATQAEPIEILLVEDNPGDVRLTQEALKDGRILNKLTVLTDGEDAIRFLRKCKDDADGRPDLILLDLNLPKVTGQEILAEVKADKDLRSIPIIVLTTSASDVDVVKAYDSHANWYVTKPVELDALLSVVRKIGTCWLSIVKLPAR